MTEHREPNADLFVRVLAQIEKQPELWRQDYWAQQTACGTALCFAGWACALTGADEWRAGINESHGKASYVAVEGDERIIDEVAAERLGLTGDLYGFSVDGLFTSTNTLADLYRISADILSVDETVLRDKVAAEVAGGGLQ